MKYGKGPMCSILETDNAEVRDAETSTLWTADDYVSSYLNRMEHYEDKRRD